ncbi:Uncharacterised protein [Mycobacterium tuberculosis]|nr:Uncharacterised protein [Mycobacterium tuberculosis]CKS88102.1 Uncharacterised protein [Mycobacterium tuberculosis]
MPLGHLGSLVCLGNNRIRLQHGGVGPETHGTAQIRLAGHDFFLIGHRGDNGIWCVGIKFGRIGVGETDRSRGLDHNALQTEAQPQHRQPARPRVCNGTDLALDAPDAESARNEHPMHIAERRRGTTGRFTTVGCHPTDLDLGPVLESAGTQCLGNREVSVG